jgi:hypothetical protein
MEMTQPPQKSAKNAAPNASKSATSVGAQ